MEDSYIRKDASSYIAIKNHHVKNTVDLLPQQF